MRKKILLIVFSVAISMVMAEVILRLLGYIPWKAITEETKIKFEPSPPFLADSILGYRLKSGTFKITQAGRVFVFTQNNRGYRLSSPDTLPPANDRRPRINILGDSFTFGTGMADSATYPWLMQLQLPEYRVENWGVPGYGVANVYVQFQQAPTPDSGDIVMYGYFGQHNNRYERRVLKMMYSHTDLMGTVGYIQLDDSLNAHFKPYDYHLWWPSKYLALSDFLEDKYNAYADRQANYDHIALKALVNMNMRCKNRGAIFILVGVLNDDATKTMLQLCAEKGIRTVDVSVDLNDKRYSQLPYDGHPNARANEVFAGRLLNYLHSQGLIMENE